MQLDAGYSLVKNALKQLSNDFKQPNPRKISRVALWYQYHCCLQRLLWYLTSIPHMVDDLD
jgi:hypothetical protein